MTSKSFRITIPAHRPRTSIVQRQANAVRASRYADRRTARLRTRGAQEAAALDLADEREPEEEWDDEPEADGL